MRHKGYLAKKETGVQANNLQQNLYMLKRYSSYIPFGIPKESRYIIYYYSFHLKYRDDLQ